MLSCLKNVILKTNCKLITTYGFFNNKNCASPKQKSERNSKQPGLKELNELKR